MMLHIQLVALALAATTLAASGCGSSKSTSTTTSTAAAAASTSTASTPTASTPTTGQATTTSEPGGALTREELIIKANVICAHANVQLAPISILVPKDFALLMPKVAAYNRAAATELGKLVPPASLASDWHQVIAAINKVAANSDLIAKYAASNKIAAATPVYREAAKAQAQVIAVTKRDGIKECNRI
jgi:hypothetical protein